MEPASPLESLIAVLMILILLGTGFYSEPWLELIDTSARNLSEIFVQAQVN